MRTGALDYDLPPDRIATHPAEPRDAARLLVAHRETGELGHHYVRDLPRLGLFEPGDLIVLNRTRVIPAAFEATRRATGGRVGGLYLHSADARHWHVLLEARGRLQPGEQLDLEPPAPRAVDAGAADHPAPGTPAVSTAPPACAPRPAALTLIEPLGRGEWRVRCDADEPTEALLQRIGHPPLPPYIRKTRRAQREPENRAEDVQRYNTVYAHEPGSIAAPTAGLHFTPELLEALKEMGVRCAMVTLHVGRGTFEPVRTETLEAHQMHEEWLHVPAETIAALRETRRAGGRILPVGTTTVRALESLPDPLEAVVGDHTARTDLFIHPDAGFEFRFTDRLMTNFHLPRSTLLAMVATLPGVGLDRLMHWYRVAIDQGYRFYSFGDAMLIA